MTDVTELARLALACRDAQRRYFRSRTAEALRESKDWERRLDRAVEDVLSPPRPGLFDAPAEGRREA